MSLRPLAFLAVLLPLAASCAASGPLAGAGAPVGPPAPPPSPPVARVEPARVAGVWELGSDLTGFPFLTNPHGDSLAEPVWSFLTAPAFDAAPSDFRPLPRFNTAAFGLPGVSAYQERVPGGLETTFPLVAVNRSGRSYTMGRPGAREWSWPAGGVVLHPNTPFNSASGTSYGVPAAVAWRSPFTGSFAVHLSLELVDAGSNSWQGGGNDGVVVQVRVGNRLLAREQVSPGGRPYLVWKRDALPVAEGESLVVVVGPGANPAGDTVLLRMTVRRVATEPDAPGGPPGMGGAHPREA